jgi:hypothetical protein
VSQTLTVLTEKSVIILLAHQQGKNAYRYAETILVLQEHPAVQLITEKAVLVTIVYRETVMSLVQNQSKLMSQNVE